MSIIEQVAEARARIRDLEQRLEAERTMLRELVAEFEKSLSEIRQEAGMSAPASRATGTRKPRSIESRFMVVLTRLRNENPYNTDLQRILREQAQKTAAKLGVAIPESVAKWIAEQKPMPIPEKKGGKK